jgi:hypothetical protein
MRKSVAERERLRMRWLLNQWRLCCGWTLGRGLLDTSDGSILVAIDNFRLEALAKSVHA